MDTPQTPQKQGLGPLAWIGIGCGGIVVLGVIGIIIFSVFFGSKIKEMGEEFQKNPTRATATMMTKIPGFELVAQDDANKRYTVKETKSGNLTTVYWSEKTQKPVTVQGGFDAIPKETEPAPR